MRASRAIALLLLLQARRTMTAAELAAELEVSERTVQRDVAALVEAGVPVYADRGRAGGYRLVDGYRTRLTGLERAEAEVLHLAALPGPLRDMGLAGHALAARLKVAAVLGDAPAGAVRRFHLDAPAWFRETEPPPLLPEVSRAVWEERVLHGRYAARGGTRERRLEPYGLVLKAGQWYLVARGASGRVGTYRVDRFETAEAGDERFERDPEFDLAGHWAAAAREFTRALLRERAAVRLSPLAVENLAVLLEATAAADALATAGPPDAEGWVTVTLPVEDWDIGYLELLRLGPEAEVIRPPELRARLAEATRRAAARYT
ncbi:helix-turn-helix transcriptional regulator [Streptomyces sp. 1331.2]|uniref:helix-turn-helix transcriptional regulator n=1 Tax=Streptomyces sp. 1331.2 TaxID=1938835 RepID=UPI000BCCE9A2|nr:WYL domain-containing protein [Streptomyces sp. 1331.2]SOB88920.1 Predicted DNA-binding transcriptional regulator YafY, contains an HTH and WYL domains [Streptomyces sp. 1331.2]